MAIKRIELITINLPHYLFLKSQRLKLINFCHIEGNGSLKQWLDKAVSLGVDERSDSLAENSALAEAHDNCARDGETDSNTTVDHHFICYLNYGDKLLEIGQLFV